jgi:hypothetical protein
VFHRDPLYEFTGCRNAIPGTYKERLWVQMGYAADTVLVRARELGMQGRETVLPITGISTGVNDPNGTESRLYGGKIRQGKARINQASRNSRDATGRGADAW